MGQAGLTAGLVLLAAMLPACSKSRSSSVDEGAAARSLADLSRIAMLAEVRGNAAGRFPAAPACTGMPPRNQHSVPADPASVSGKEYRPSSGDWSGPWAELPFASGQPTRSVYCFGGVEDGTRFTVYAASDIDGDGTWSVLAREGRIIDGRAAVGPVVESSGRAAEPAGESRCEGIENCRQACDAGSAWGCQRYGKLLLDAGDKAGAEAALRRSCDAGFGFGCLGLAVVLQDAGRMAEAEEASRRGCDAGDAQACRNLGALLQNAPDRAPATEALAKACRLGDAKACPVAFRRTADDDGPAATEPIGRAWCELATDEGCFWLGECLRLTGRADESRAAYQRSCAAGKSSACEMIGTAPAADAS